MRRVTTTTTKRKSRVVVGITYPIWSNSICCSELCSDLSVYLSQEPPHSFNYQLFGRQKLVRLLHLSFGEATRDSLQTRTFFSPSLTSFFFFTSLSVSFCRESRRSVQNGDATNKDCRAIAREANINNPTTAAAAAELIHHRLQQQRSSFMTVSASKFRTLTEG